MEAPLIEEVGGVGVHAEVGTDAVAGIQVHDMAERVNADLNCTLSPTEIAHSGGGQPRGKRAVSDVILARELRLEYQDYTIYQARIGNTPVTLRGQFIHREDASPTFTLGEPKAITNGGFGEALWHRSGSRWYGIALYSLIDTSEPLLDVGLGRSGGPVAL